MAARSGEAADRLEIIIFTEDSSNVRASSLSSYVLALVLRYSVPAQEHRRCATSQPRAEEAEGNRGRRWVGEHTPWEG